MVQEVKSVPKSKLTIRRTLKHLTGITIILLLTACGGGGSAGGASTGQGTLAVRLTDNHTDAVEEVNVYIVGLMIKLSNGPVQTLNCCNTKVDLLSLAGTSQLLAVAQVQEGTYEFIQIELDESQSNIVENGVTKTLQIPSEKIKVLGGFEVQAGLTTTVVLDFDAHESLVLQGNGQWLLTPVILLANVSMS